MKRDMQTLTLDTIVGPKPVLAPGGWEFDKTATIAWAKLLELVREQRKPQKLKRDEYVLDGQSLVLSVVLANSLGMASFYWREQARGIVRSEAE